MADLFKDKSQDWDANSMRLQLSSNIGGAMLDAITFHESMEIMDFGAGTGLVSEKIAPLVNTITAVDISESMLEQLSQKDALKGKVQIACQDILDNPLSQKFDGIVSAMALHHVDNTQLCIQRFAEHLKPGGFVALADLDTEDGTFHPPGIEGVFHDGFDREHLKGLFENAGFANVSFCTAHTVRKEKEYPIFLVTATK